MKPFYAWNTPCSHPVPLDSKTSAKCARIRKRWRRGRFPIALIGEKADLAYAYDYLGAGADTLNEVIAGRHSFAETLKKAELEVKKNPPKDKSLQVLAFEEVARKMELKQQYEQLRNMIVYELGLPGGFWTDFEQTLYRLEQEHERDMELAEYLRQEAEWQRRIKIDRMQEVALEVVVVLVMLAYLAALIWSVMLHRGNRLDVWLPSP